LLYQHILIKQKINKLLIKIAKEPLMNLINTFN
jgi:hypothetical protein